MKIKTVIKKIQKRLGVDVIDRGSGHYMFCSEGYIGKFNTSCGDKAAGFHVRREDDHSDSMTDYFAGSFYNNCTQMLNAIDPRPPKFPEGSLVRGKNNKRAMRLGISGRIGLVTKINSYSYYILLMTDTGQTERYSYERDLELAI
jgi:hypothetical protein